VCLKCVSDLTTPEASPFPMKKSVHDVAGFFFVTNGLLVMLQRPVDGALLTLPVAAKRRYGGSDPPTFSKKSAKPSHSQHLISISDWNVRFHPLA
jgi:hypothetical protein